MVLKFVYLKYLYDEDSLKISGVDLVKERNNGKGGVEVTMVSTYKTPFMVNGKLVTVYLALG